MSTVAEIIISDSRRKNTTELKSQCFVKIEYGPSVDQPPETEYDDDQRDVTFSSIIDLDHNDFCLKRGIPVTVEHVDELNFVASFHEANMNASGDSVAEAIANLKDVISFKFRHFSSLKTGNLGPEPKRQLAMLRRYITEA